MTSKTHQEAQPRKAHPVVFSLPRFLLGWLSILICFLLRVPVELAVAQDNASTIIHTVSWGETLHQIAADYHVAVNSIIAANNLGQPDRIFAGQQLIIPDVTLPSQHGGLAPQTHVVQAGENLYRIGLKYGVSFDAILIANRLANADQIYAGQTLVIPPAGASAVRDSAETPPHMHIVQAGETLYSISRQYNVSVPALSQHNGLLNPSHIFVGQSLAIPGSATSPRAGYSPTETTSTHIVQPGETLFTIASRYGVSAWILAQVNSIGNPSLIYTGQTLVVPVPDALSSTQGSPDGHAKSIVVDVSDQRAYVYEGGQLKWTFIVSTGLPGVETWRGNFHVQNKLPVAYAANWDLEMPYWLGFYWAGSLQNGFHALPILANGVRLWEGLLGRPASYGCVILSDQDAELLYQWAEIGIPVTVRD